MNNKKNIKHYQGLSTYKKLLLCFICITLFVSFVSGAAHYFYAKKILKKSITAQLENNLEQAISYFYKAYVINIHSDLDRLEESDKIDHILTSEKDQIYYYLPKLEREFLNLIKKNNTYLSLRFINSSGIEQAVVKETKRIKEYKSIDSYDKNNLLDNKIFSLFNKLKSSTFRTILFEGPFKDNEGTLTVLIGISKLEPDIGGFGGAVILQFDLTDYVAYLSGLKIFGRSLVWLFDTKNQILLSPSEEVISLDPRPFIAKTDNYKNPDEDILIFSKNCILGTELQPVMKVSFSAPAEIISEKMKGALSITLWAAFGVITIASFIAFFVARQFSNPIYELVEISNLISKGDLTVKAPIKWSGEIGLLAKTFNKMTEDLQNTTVSQNYMDNILNSMKDMVIVFSKSWVIKTINPAALKLLKYEEKNIIESSFKDIIGDDDAGKKIWFDELFEKGSIKNIDTTYLTIDGKKIPVSLSASVMKNSSNKIQGAVCVAQDITERKRSEKKLKKMNEKLEASNNELTQFAYIASHDLQEPLRKVILFGERLKSRSEGALNEQSLDYLERMQNSSKRMQTLIVDLLSYSRIATKTRPFEPVNLRTLMKEVLSDLEVRIEQSGGKVEYDYLPTINADPTQMRQLFQNLISNALKFQKKHIAPLVKITSQPLNGKKNNEESFNVFGISHEIIVEDNGIGFEEKYENNIFGVFQRLHGRSEYEGTGIGLAVCRKIVRRHGGTITAKGDPERGATFIINLPENSEWDTNI